MKAKQSIPFLLLLAACEQAPPAMALGELDSRDFGAVAEPSITATNGAILAKLEKGIVSLSVETTKGTATDGKHPYGKVVVRMIDNSAEASSVDCKIEEPTQRGYDNGPMQWVVDIYCNYTAHKAFGSDIGLTVMPDLGVKGGQRLVD